uniref:Uncharacterized protein n=1 Tax=Davidia involucrata TaxID=16924 RepID=A0A5B7AI39_DAVIN
MEPSNTESNQASSTMESEHVITSNGDLRTRLATAINDVRISNSGKKLSSSSFTSSSSSPDSPFGDPFQEHENEHYESTLGTTSPHKLDDNAHLASNFGENDVSGSSISKLEQSNHELPTSTLSPAITSETPELSLNNVSTTDSPPIQVMVRSGDSYPMEWSITSNESLFSIHMGNMSFSKDYIFWRSGELGMPGEASTSSQFFNFSTNNPPEHEETNTGNSSESVCIAQAAVETMREILRESEEDQSSKKLSLAPSISCQSDSSGVSVKSFAFPILTGDREKGGSAKMRHSVKVGPEQPQLQLQPPPELEPKTPAATQTKWFSCCSFCSWRKICWPKLSCLCNKCSI